MKKYVFSMEKVLNWRNSQEEEAKKVFLNQKSMQVKEELKLSAMIEASEELKKSTASLTNINSMRQQHLYQNFLAEQIVSQEERVDLAAAATEVELTHFVAAQKERKILEKLSERHYESYLAELKLAEQKELDEMGSLRYGLSK